MPSGLYLLSILFRFHVDAQVDAQGNMYEKGCCLTASSSFGEWEFGALLCLQSHVQCGNSGAVVTARVLPSSLSPSRNNGGGRERKGREKEGV